MDKISIPYPIICEGKYDKNTLSSTLDAKIITLGGFSVFNNKELRALITKMAEKDRIILLLDSDGGGVQIRTFIESFISKDKIINLYIPKIPGKEKRKKKPGKAGLLGVEGMDAEVIRSIFTPFAGALKEKTDKITKTDLFTLGLSGGDGSAKKRKEVLISLGLPDDMSANAMLDALNVISSKEELIKLVNNGGKDND